jgi:flotillin
MWFMLHPLLTVVAVLGVVVAVCVAFYASRYEKVGPNEVLIVSGRPGTYESPTTMQRTKRNFRIYHGGGTFVWPVRERVDRMSVELMTLEIRTPEFYTKFGVPIVVDGIAQIKVRSDDPIATVTAAEMFLSRSRAEMNEIAHQMMQGHLRGVISTMPFEEIHRNPEAFAQAVQHLTAEDLANMGIQVVSFTIREIRDPSGYLKAVGRPQLAQVQRDADLGEAEAHRDSAKGKALAEREAAVVAAKATEESRVAELSADLAIAQAQRDKDLKTHEFNAQVAEARATQEAAYDIQKARMEQQVAEERMGVTRVEREKQIEVEQLEVVRREKELDHTVRKPAEAEHFRIEALAQAEQNRIRMMAEAEAGAQRLRGLAQADVVRATGDAEAEAIRQRGLAEGEALQAKWVAEAEGMRQKAEAWQQYNSAAIAELFIERLPEIAQAIASPLSQVDRITLVSSGSGGSAGVERITESVTGVLAQIPGVAELLRAVDLTPLLAQLQPAKAQEPVSGEVPAESATGDAV